MRHENRSRSCPEKARRCTATHITDQRWNLQTETRAESPRPTHHKSPDWHPGFHLPNEYWHLASPFWQQPCAGRRTTTLDDAGSYIWVRCAACNLADCLRLGTRITTSPTTTWPTSFPITKEIWRYLSRLVRSIWNGKKPNYCQLRWRYLIPIATTATEVLEVSHYEPTGTGFVICLFAIGETKRKTPSLLFSLMN